MREGLLKETDVIYYRELFIIICQESEIKRETLTVIDYIHNHDLAEKYQHNLPFLLKESCEGL